MAIVFECVFIFLFFIMETYYYSTSERHMCSVYFHQATIGKSNQKNWKNTIILVFEKVIQLVARALVTVRKKIKVVKVKSQHWRILKIWKRSNKIKVVKMGVTLKVLCQWQSQNSELLRSVLKILSFRNKFWVILCLLL